MMELKVPRVAERRAVGARPERGTKVWLAAFGLVGLVGGCLFLWGQGLAALLLPSCGDYGRDTLTRECQQPLFLVKAGMWLVGTALLGVSVISVWFFTSRRRGSRSG